MGIAEANRRRSKRQQRYNCVYFPFKPPGHWRDNSCCYCGNQAESRDHIPPLVWIEALGLSWFEERNLATVWVPSCIECNNLLRDERLFTIGERTSWLLRQYEKRYQGILQAPKWTEVEINELRGRLRKSIREWSTAKLGIGRRLIILSENEILRAVRDDVRGDEDVAEVLQR